MDRERLFMPSGRREKVSSFLFSAKNKSNRQHTNQHSVSCVPILVGVSVEGECVCAADNDAISVLPLQQISSVEDEA